MSHMKLTVLTILCLAAVSSCYGKRKIAGVQFWSEKEYQGATANLSYCYDIPCYVFPPFPHNVSSLKVYDHAHGMLFYKHENCQPPIALEVDPLQEIPDLNEIEGQWSDDCYAPFKSYTLTYPDVRIS